MKTFTQYLQTIHSYKFTEVLDDNLSNHFDHWVSGLDIDDLIQYADFYAKNQIENYKFNLKDE